MKTITDQIAAKTKLKVLPEAGDPQKLYSMFNDGGVECETGEFLYGLVRLLKPERVLETGTHRGIGASYIASALKDNGKGMLDTIEFIPEHFSYSLDFLSKQGLGKFVTMHMQDATEFKPEEKYDLIFLDTEPQTRFAELIRFEPWLNDGGFIFIHDLHRHMHQIPNEEHGFAWPFGLVPQSIKQLVNADILRPFHFPSPRGMTGFYKVTEGDFKWAG